MHVLYDLNGIYGDWETEDHAGNVFWEEMGNNYVYEHGVLYTIGGSGEYSCIMWCQQLQFRFTCSTSHAVYSFGLGQQYSVPA